MKLFPLKSVPCTPFNNFVISRFLLYLLLFLSLYRCSNLNLKWNGFLAQNLPGVQNIEANGNQVIKTIRSFHTNWHVYCVLLRFEHEFGAHNIYERIGEQITNNPHSAHANHTLIALIIGMISGNVYLLNIKYVLKLKIFPFHLARKRHARCILCGEITGSSQSLALWWF